MRHRSEARPCLDLSPLPDLSRLSRVARQDKRRPPPAAPSLGPLPTPSSPPTRAPCPPALPPKSPALCTRRKRPAQRSLGATRAPARREDGARASVSRSTVLSHSSTAGGLINGNAIGIADSSCCTHECACAHRHIDTETHRHIDQRERHREGGREIGRELVTRCTSSSRVALKELSL